MSAALALADLGAESRPSVRGPITRAPGSRVYTFRFTAGDARVFRPRNGSPYRPASHRLGVGGSLPHRERRPISRPLVD
jgi:hypothetical protein